MCKYLDLPAIILHGVSSSGMVPLQYASVTSFVVSKAEMCDLGLWDVDRYLWDSQACAGSGDVTVITTQPHVTMDDDAIPTRTRASKAAVHVVYFQQEASCGCHDRAYLDTDLWGHRYERCACTYTSGTMSSTGSNIWGRVVLG
jgi:hypothetical protein